MGRPRDALPFLFETCMYWGLNAFGMWILAWACGVEHADGTPIHFAEACALMGMLGATILIPGPPGLLGLFHVGIYCGMTFYFSPKIIEGPGSVYVFLLYVIQLVWTLACAGYFLRDPKAREELREAEHDVEVAAAAPEAAKAAEAPEGPAKGAVVRQLRPKAAPPPPAAAAAPAAVGGWIEPCDLLLCARRDGNEALERFESRLAAVFHAETELRAAHGSDGDATRGFELRALRGLAQAARLAHREEVLEVARVQKAQGGSSGLSTDEILALSVISVAA